MNYLKFNGNKEIITVNHSYETKFEYLYATPTKTEEIPLSMLKKMADDVELAPYHSLIAIIGIPELSSFANNKTNRFSNVKPIFLSCSKDSIIKEEFVSKLKIGDSISISSSDIEMGLHIYCKSNKLTSNIINTIGNKYSFGKDKVMIINTKIIPDSAINAIIRENNTYAKGTYDLGFCNKNGKSFNWNKSTNDDIIIDIKADDLLKQDSCIDFSKIATYVYKDLAKDNVIKGIDIPITNITYKKVKEIIKELISAMNELGSYYYFEIDKLKTISNNKNNYYSAELTPSKEEEAIDCNDNNYDIKSNRHLS